ncbi:phosphate ABC transporter permease subunit PstC [Candidatus Nitronereus thalassa]|uniref:Phosphate transport system permease protein n=1 Tax=Candidatus Nitronereus thalassa TaxID=3020898 RepID=A0ABU3KA84_9BACT|nr:phosphate ABC transporter permease subunit PstC [Candidatus Nitronereus thalassa]MDT7043198.1 phosphate ABC transporter permease subunit PstC [Candidatus Nitronereus thalassa]
MPSFHWHPDRFLHGALWVCAGLAGLILVFIVMFVIMESVPALQHIGIERFAFDSSWHPGEGSFNLVPMIIGTVLITVGAIVLAGPLGFFSALFCQWYAPPLIAALYSRFIELLAGIPSVVFGFWGLVVLVPLINQWHPPGASLLAGIFILALMILPTMSLLVQSSLAQVPTEYIHGAAALGMGRWSTLRRVVIPSAKSGLWTAGLLATARALGETMAVLMVCGNVAQLPSSIFDPIRTLTANMALEMAYAVDDHRSALFVSGLALLLMVLVLMTAVHWYNRAPHHA